MQFRRMILPLRTTHNPVVSLTALLLGSAFMQYIGATARANDAPATDKPIPDKILFNQHVRPILSDKCFACHGFDSKKRQAELRLDTEEGALTGHGDSTPITPGNLDKSEVWKRIIATDSESVMPPKETHKSLTAREIEIVKRWIEQGAAYQKHWAFEPPVAALPTVANNNGQLNPIDLFIEQRLNREGLALSPEASKEILIRRVSFALTGLPPTIAETERFLSDTSPDAYESMVDRYLANEHFGEEMARHWLDVARYADTHGMHLDNERQTWAYRDWVVSAFNRNLPFDAFTKDQIAGDLAPNATPEQLIATGYNRCNVTTSEGGSIDDELLYRYAVDRASTTMQTWMGLTGGCAVCHDHKFDPITQKEFYSFYAFFNSAADPAMDGNALLTQPVLKLENEESRAKLAQFDAQIMSKQQEIDSAVAKVTYNDPAKIEPAPTAVTIEDIWMDDDFPSTGKLQASPGAPTMFVSADAGTAVFSGQKALKRTDAGLAQDVWEGASVPLNIPQDGVLFAYVWLDPSNAPRSIMMQYFKNGWMHRGVWGDYEVIPWGAPNTTERVLMGPLPAVGQWVKIEIPVEKIGLKSGDQITGFALTQFGGTVLWDKVGITGISNPATDPSRSFLAWWKATTGKDTPGLPGDLNQIAKDGPEKAPSADAEARLRVHYLQNVCTETKPQFASMLNEKKLLADQRKALDDSIPSTFIFRDRPTPRDSFVMMRGAYDKPGDKVEPSVPAVFPQIKKPTPESRATRTELANWLIAEENPLTSRVTVNRFWQQLFGIGLVKTSWDFGSQGESPSHPELLDWLAVHFQKTGWDMKSLIRLMVCSKTFRQQSRITPDLYRLDPENRLYARGPRYRLDAEQIRDNALFVSGLINLQMGGKGVKPYQPDNIWEPVGFSGSNTQYYRRDSGPALYRRSIYTFYKRTAPPPFMVNFDAPNREQFCTKREKSNTPLQALQLMNDIQHVEAARAMAQRMIREGGNTTAERVGFAYRTILSRTPNERELQVIEKQLAAHAERYGADTEAAKKLITVGESKPDESLNPSELAAYTMVANMILNLDETVTRN